MDIAFYCPDRHFLYDGTTPDQQGVGGGLTVRIRIAAALAKRGHRVSLICNCPRPGTHQGVSYIPLEQADRIHATVLVMHSSGGDIDLTPLLSIPIEARLRIFLLSGLDVAKSVHDLHPDSIYVCSNFIRAEMRRTAFPHHHIFTAHYGINRWNRAATGWLAPARDPRALIYSSHPSKGFEPARAVTRLLREKDPRFTLYYAGGNRLWGAAMPEQPPPAEPGIVYGGLINQRRLAAQYKRSGFLLQLQTRREPFGIVVVEAMAAGCLVVASPVGAFPELIDHGENGFLVEGDPAHPDTLQRAAQLIASVSQNPALLEKIRRRAFATPFDWDTLAQAWESHILWRLDPKASRHLEAPWARCLECEAPTLALADGYHCTACGHFARHAQPQSLTPNP